MKIIQSLYEKKMTTYPRVDTNFLPNDIYPKVPGILKGLKPYVTLIDPIINGSKIRKSPKVFNDKKITDHHAIIPTGVFSYDMTPDEKRVYDLVARRFIAVFYPDCEIANTTVMAQVGVNEFKATGKQIIDPAWRVVFPAASNKQSDENVLPVYEVGEKGPHTPELQEKETQPPKYYTEADLLRAMETAGKQVEDEELRDLMKENGIGRPSTRAGIIETLLKRGYIRKDKKRLVATATGIELIDTIQNVEISRVDREMGEETADDRGGDLQRVGFYGGVEGDGERVGTRGEVFSPESDHRGGGRRGGKRIYPEREESLEEGESSRRTRRVEMSEMRERRDYQGTGGLGV